MKVLFVASDTFPHIGGKSSHIRDLMKGLRAINVDCQVISLSSLGRTLEIMIKAPIFAVKLINIDLFYYLFARIWSKILNRLVYTYCLRNSPDFISVQDAFAAQSISDTIKQLRIHTSLTMHTYFGIEHSLDKRMGVLSRVIYRMHLADELQALNVVDGVVAVDQRIHEHVKANIDERVSQRIQTTSIMNFTDTDLYMGTNAVARVDLRKRYNVANDVFIVVCTRRLVEKNGVIYAVRAMQLIDDDKIRLFIAGDGPQRKSIEDYILQHGLENRIVLFGSVDEKIALELYHISDVSIVPSVTVNSLQEATSISAIEAMSCGVPIIASNIGGLAQLIKHNHTGVLVDEADEEAIAREIVRLKNNNDLYQRISMDGMAWARMNHSHLSAARQYLGFFESLNNGKR